MGKLGWVPIGVVAGVIGTRIVLAVRRERRRSTEAVKVEQESEAHVLQAVGVAILRDATDLTVTAEHMIGQDEDSFVEAVRTLQESRLASLAPLNDAALTMACAEFYEALIMRRLGGPHAQSEYADALRGIKVLLGRTESTPPAEGHDGGGLARVKAARRTYGRAFARRVGLIALIYVPVTFVPLVLSGFIPGLLDSVLVTTSTAAAVLPVLGAFAIALQLIARTRGDETRDEMLARASYVGWVAFANSVVAISITVVASGDELTGGSLSPAGSLNIMIAVLIAISAADTATASSIQIDNYRRAGRP